jgi:hypothetical protein
METRAILFTDPSDYDIAETLEDHGILCRHSFDYSAVPQSQSPTQSRKGLDQVWTSIPIHNKPCWFYFLPGTVAQLPGIDVPAPAQRRIVYDHIDRAADIVSRLISNDVWGYVVDQRLSPDHPWTPVAHDWSLLGRDHAIETLTTKHPGTPWFDAEDPTSPHNRSTK